MEVTFNVFLIILLSSLCWAGHSVLLKLYALKLPHISLVILVSIGQALCFLFYLFSEAIVTPGPQYLSIALLAILINVSSQIFFLKSIAIAPLSQTIPFLALVPVVTVIGGWLLGETLSIVQVRAIGLIVLGSIIVTLPQQSKLKPDRKSLLGVALMVLTATLWGIGIPLDKLALNYTSISLHGFILTAGTALVLAIYCHSNREKWTNTLRLSFSSMLFLAPLVAALALIFQFFAIAQAPVALVESLKRAGMIIFGVFFGKVLFAEKVGWRRWVGAGLLVVGSHQIVV